MRQGTMGHQEIGHLIEDIVEDFGMETRSEYRSAIKRLVSAAIREGAIDSHKGEQLQQRISDLERCIAAHGRYAGNAYAGKDGFGQRPN